MNILQGIIMSELMKAKTEQPTSRPQGIVQRLRRVSAECGGSLERDAADEIERLQVALARYGWHHENCPYLQSVTACTCGYDALRIADHASADHSNEVQS
jgi:hypothetical protein